MAQERTDDVVDILAGLALFADLSRPQLQAVAHTLDEEWFTEGQRVLRQGFGGANFYIILDGEAAVKIDGETRATLGRGEFFGEVSALLGETPTADVVATRPLRCAVLAGSEIEQFLQAYPPVMYRMLQAQARRLRNANRWRS
jgi:CRP-like cAMP-binding protein